MAIAQVSIVPLGTGTTSLSVFVAEAARWLEAADITYQLTPMGTILEGDVESLLNIIKMLHELPFQAGAARVMTLITLDDRRDKPATAQGKVNSVRAQLGQV